MTSRIQWRRTGPRAAADYGPGAHSRRRCGFAGLARARAAFTLQAAALILAPAISASAQTGASPMNEARAGAAQPAAVQTAAQNGPLVFAAASLTDVLQRIGADYAANGRAAPRFSFGSTAVLARQIESGARAEVFLSADAEWMDYLEARGALRPGTRSDLLGNRLVLVAPAASTLRVELKPGVDLLSALGAQGRLALADPTSVPAGRYAKEALTTLGAWRSLEPRIASADNVRAALMFVARGEAPLGVVYRTDALTEPRVRVVGEFPTASHRAIVYPVALTRAAGPAAEAFLQYLRGAPARARFDAAGFPMPLAVSATPSRADRMRHAMR
jgi:molybdate transport system substrate-binding protein